MRSYQVMKYKHLITKARLSLTHSTPLPHVPKAKHSQLRKKKRLALDKLQSCLGGRVVKAMDFGSDGALCSGSIPGTADFFFFFYFLMMMV